MTTENANKHGREPERDATSELRSTGWLAPDETISLLQKAKDEILQLRRTNEVYGAKLEMFDCLMLLLHTKPAERQYPMGVDVAWELDKHAEEIRRRFSTSERG